jgi:hypothetical protein
MPILGLGLNGLVAIFFAVHAVRNGQERYWLFVLFGFPLIGSIVYAVAIWLPEQRNTRHGRALIRGVKASIDPGRELRDAQLALDESRSATNQVRMADALMASGKASQAVVHYDNALAGVHADSPDIEVRFAQALVEAGQPEKARTRLEELIARLPGYRSATGHLVYARAVAATGDRLKSREEFEAVIGGFAGLEARAHYATVLADWGENDAAAALCQASVVLASRMPRHAQQLNAPWTRVLKSLARDLDKAGSNAVQPG